MTEKVVLKIEFPNQKALELFARWLDNSGEQNYSNYTDFYLNEEEEKFCTNVFQYHEIDNNYPNNDRRHYGKYLANNTIKAIRVGDD